MSYARIGYHYARPGLTDDHLEVTPDDLRLPLLPENWQPAARMGAANAVFFAAEDIATNAEATHLTDGRLWTGGKLFIWTPTKSSGQKSFKIPVSLAGRQQIHVALAMTALSGKIAFRIDGRPLLLEDGAEKVDLYCSYRTLLRSIAQMPVELQAGDHILTLEVMSTPDKVTNPEIGIDFIWVQRK